MHRGTDPDFPNENCIIAGDWNSNKIFDYIKRIGTHSDTVHLLKIYIRYIVRIILSLKKSKERKPSQPTTLEKRKKDPKTLSY
jgi:hypothetical protein